MSSRAELHTAIGVGVDPQSIIFVGPAKAHAEIADCIRFGIFAIVAESEDELSIIDGLAADRGAKRPVNVMLRVNPDFNSGGSGLTMGGKPRQFGIDAEQIPALRSTLSGLARVKVTGFHVYMGTRYLEAGPIIENTERILALSIDLAGELGITLEAVDVGGGFGVPYFSNECPLDFDAVTEGVNAAISRFRDTHPRSRVIIELGRFLTAGCGAMVTTVRYKKALLRSSPRSESQPKREARYRPATRRCPLPLAFLTQPVAKQSNAFGRRIRLHTHEVVLELPVGRLNVFKHLYEAAVGQIDRGVCLTGERESETGDGGVLSHHFIGEPVALFQIGMDCLRRLEPHIPAWRLPGQRRPVYMEQPVVDDLGRVVQTTRPFQKLRAADRPIGVPD